jgi:hypothetical protein
VEEMGKPVSARLETLIEAAQGLSPLEQLNLIGALSESLRRDYQQLLAAKDFWEPPTLEQLVAAQQTQPVTSIADLAAEFWPENESADDIVEYVYQQRREDRSMP